MHENLHDVTPVTHDRPGAGASPPSEDEKDEDDNWQPQTHGPDVAPQPSKRKRQATVTDEEDDEFAKPRRKKTRSATAKKPAKPKATPKVKKPKVYDGAKEFNRIAEAEQVRLANAPNKHIAAMRS